MSKIVESYLGRPLLFWPMNNPDRVSGGNLILPNSVVKPVSSIPLTHDKKNIKESFRKNDIESFSLNFDGRNDGATADNFAGHCLGWPDRCDNGITIAFFMNYQGREARKNFIFSDGALPWTGFNQTGISMWVEDKLATVSVQTKAKLFSAKFTIRHDIRVFYTITFSSGGLQVYGNAQHLAGDILGKTKAGEESNILFLVFGKAQQVTGFNGRFDMDNFCVYVKSLSIVDIENLYAYGVDKLA